MSTTTRLYYEDSYLTEFTARVLEQRLRGGSPAVLLDRTAFYPASGGQPHDTGQLGGVRVLNVEEEEATGEILHILDSALPAAPVEGRVDWERRFDHMQQHTGQHVLSQAFLRTAGAQTLSFHLGQSSSSIDLDLAQPTPNLVEAAEELACSILFRNRLVTVLSVDRESLAALGVRKESQREGVVRVVDIEGFDRSPCGGTHVSRCGEIGMIAILGYERYKGGTRVEFVCGGRARKALRRDHAILQDLGKLHSAHPDELPRLTEKLLAARSALARENSRMHDQLVEMEARELQQNADMKAGVAVIRRLYEDRSPESVKLLAQKASAAARGVAILGLLGETAIVVVARSPDAPGDCGRAVKLAAGQLGGRGGGGPLLAQAGGIPPAALEAWMNAVERCFSGS